MALFVQDGYTVLGNYGVLLQLLFMITPVFRTGWGAWHCLYRVDILFPYSIGKLSNYGGCLDSRLC